MSVLVAFAAGCSGGGGGGSASSQSDPTAVEPTSTGALIVDGEVDVDAADAFTTEFAKLDETARYATVNELAGQFERQRYEAFGLAEAVGGPAAVDESITETATWMAGLGVNVADSVGAAQLEPQGFRRSPAQTAAPNIGEGLFGGLVVTMLGGEAVVSATNDGATGEGKLADGVTVKAKADTVELTTKGSFTDSKGVTTTLETHNVASPCPKADGTFEASATIDTSATVNNGATGSRGTFDVTVKGTVDDNAALVGYDTTYRGQYADFVASRGGFIDVTGTRPATGASDVVVNRGGGTITDEIVTNAVKLGQMVSWMVGVKLVEAAKNAWESGRCVVLTPVASAGPTGLAPSATVTIKAAPRSKMDGGAVGGNVTAQLTGGGASVAPSATKVPADATFTYIAPDKKDETGVVALEARSKRGVAKATIDFDTKQAGYTASGGSGVSFSGTVPDLAAPFTLAGQGTGFTVEFSFTPADSRSGSLSYTGSGGGASLKGTGTYTIAGDEPGPLTLSYNAEGCANVGGCRSTSNAITLTPIGG
jgi:hypothetical protein